MKKELVKIRIEVKNVKNWKTLILRRKVSAVCLKIVKVYDDRSENIIENINALTGDIINLDFIDN